MKKKEMIELVDRNYDGVDLGNSYTKSRKIRFASKVKLGKKLTGVAKTRLKKDVHYVEYEGQYYVVGDGKMFTTAERYFSTQYKLCLLTAIALNHPGEEFIQTAVCVGLPFKYHKLYAQRIIDLYSNKQYNITVNDKKYTIRITDMEVFVEGSLPIRDNDSRHILTIDVGGGTIDVTQFNNLEIEKFETYPTAMNNIYADIVDYLYDNNLGEFTPSKVEKFFNKTTIMVDQQPVDISGIREVIQQDITEVASWIRDKFDTQDVDEIYIMGGGGMDTYKYWRTDFPTSKLAENTQFVNSDIYEMVAKEIANE